MRRLSGPRTRRSRTIIAVLLVIVLTTGYWAVRLIDLKGDIGRYSRYWAHPRGSAGGLVYVALGDSAAQGLGASRPERAYVELVAARLRTSTGRPVRVVNLSRSGAQIRDVIRDQVPRLAALHADLVTVDIGGNDIVRYDRRRFEADAAELCRLLPSGAVIADVPYFMHGKWERDAASGARYLAGQARAHGLAVAPLHQALRATGWTGMARNYAADWFHPNDRGHRIWAAAFWSAIASEVPALAAS